MSPSDSSFFTKEILLTMHQCFATRIYETKQVTHGLDPGGVRTPIALHCGSFIFNMAVKAAEIGKL